MFLIQGLWLTGRQTLTDRDYQYARCGREMWERPSPLAGYFTTCGNIHDGILAYRLAGLPLTLNLLLEQGLDHFRKPEDRVVQFGTSNLSTWELRHQLTHVLLLERLPFLLAGCMLGAGLWWVTRRLYGNLGGYTALALYCFSPVVLKACVSPNAEVLAALGVYGGVYTSIGVAHAMLGPRQKMASAHRAADGDVWRGGGFAYRGAAVGGVAGAGDHAVGSRGPPSPGAARAAGGLSRSAGAGLRLLRLLARCLQLSIPLSRRLSCGSRWIPARRFFSTLGNAGITVAAAAALVLYLGVRRSRYFGNTAPLLCAMLLFVLVMTGAPGTPWLWALPFLLTFVAGVFADAYEGPRGRLALCAAGAIVLLQAVFCVLSLPGLL